MAALEQTPPPAPLQFMVQHPSIRDNSIYFHLTPLPSHLQLLLTTRPSGSMGGPPPAVGTMIYALPNVRNPKEGPLTTPLLVRQDSLDLTTAVAKALAGRTGRAVTLACDFGYKEDDVTERIALIKSIVDAVLSLVSTDKDKKEEATTKG